MDARLRGGVVDLPILPGLPVDRADVDDAPELARAHPRKGRLRHVEAAAEIDADNFVPHLVSHLEERSVAGDTGVVDDDIDTSVVGLDRGDGVEARLMVGDVPFERCNAGPLGKLGGLLVVAAVIGNDGCPGCLKRKTDRLTDAACAACNDCDPCHVAPLPRAICQQP